MSEPHDPNLSSHAAPRRPRMPHRRQLPRFAERALDRQLAIDKAIRVTVLVSLALALILISLEDQSMSSFWLNLMVVGIAVAWVGMGMVSAKVAQQLPYLTELVQVDEAAAESVIANAMIRRPLQRTVRLMLYHRLAMLRHRQARFDEAAAIERALLTRPLAGAEGLRPHLLLMLAEARLHLGDLASAAWALSDLHRSRVNLIELMQLLVLQTRYEVLAGYDEAALRNLDRKIALAELMPAAQCGSMHAMLAAAATRACHEDTARWLSERARLLCTPAQLQSLWTAPEPMTAATEVTEVA